MSMKAVLVGAVVGAVLLFGAEGSAEAQGTNRSGGARIITLDEIVIEGQVQRPNAFYILNRSSLGYEVLDLRTSFVREIVRSVSDEPF